MDDVFKALADPVRRELLDRLRDRNGQTLGELGEGLSMSRQAVTKHLAILEAANLVAFERRGRERLHHLNPIPIQEVSDRWIGAYQRAPAAALTHLKRTLEGETTMSTRFFYVIYIRTTPEKLFEALTDPDTNRRFWMGYAQISDWKKGAAWSVQDAGGKAWDEGEVLEFEPPRKIVVSWRHIHDEAVRAEGFSRASFEIEPMGEVVKLTLTHEIDVENSKLIQGVSGGWPMILSNLKSLLETGATLPGSEQAADAG